MRQVLFKIGLGSQLVRLIMSILTDQEAQIMLNDWEGERFPLRCGTRQGNPLSPLLFNLALEPFLLSLQSLSGIPIEYEGVLIESMKYHAFADDVNIYLGEDEDYQKAAQAINAFERVSNSRVSETKTKLLGFQEDFPQFQQEILPYPQYHIEDEEEDVKYLGLDLKGMDWSKFLSKLPYMTMKQGYMHIDLITRAIGTNVFVSSKTVYKDLVQCMGAGQLTKMDSGIHTVFKGIGSDTMYARPKKGGYGLLEMKTQLQGHRAAVLASTLSDDKDWYTRYLRLKLTHHMAKIMSGDPRAHIGRSKGLYVSDFLLEKSGKFFENLKWTFTKTEICYLKAWQENVPRSRIYETSTLVEDNWISPSYVAPGKGTDGFMLSEEEEKGCHPSNFTSLSKKKQEKLKPVMPTHFLELCPEAKGIRRWEKFWKTLHKFEWRKHRDLRALHHFNLGFYVPVHDAKKSVPRYKCHLCLTEVNMKNIQSHLYNDCACTKFWWNLLNIETPMNLNSMLAPLHNTYEPLRNLNWYVETVRRVYCSRRREAQRGIVLQPLSHRQLKKAMGHSKAKTS
ncbi:hypothetical protein JCM33374_g2830 [Metschnikowia sp. JCM 33374]|nr:hypothetical protein JCM33374_g2830 [Metschnikowia sp. JCM 33374]